MKALAGRGQSPAAMRSTLKLDHAPAHGDGPEPPAPTDAVPLRDALTPLPPAALALASRVAARAGPGEGAARPRCGRAIAGALAGALWARVGHASSASRCALARSELRMGARRVRGVSAPVAAGSRRSTAAVSTDPCASRAVASASAARAR